MVLGFIQAQYKANQGESLKKRCAKNDFKRESSEKRQSEKLQKK